MWLAEQRSGTIPLEVMESFEKLQKIAAENNVSFEDLCVYALGSADEKPAAQAAEPEPVAEPAPPPEPEPVAAAEPQPDLRQAVAEKTVCIMLMRGESPDGGAIYAYVAVRADKLEEFMAAQKAGTFYPEDYGVIVESGEGEPPEDVRERMERDYGFNHQAMVDIPDEGGARRVVDGLLPVAEKKSPDSA